MKKIIFLLTILVCGFISQAQNPIPADSTFPIPQSVANAPKTIAKTNVMQAMKGFINGVFTDTTAANAYSATATTGGYRLKYYPGAQIFTSSDSSFWIRNSTATRWMKPEAGAINITSFTFDNDTTGIICFSTGVCDTFSIVNLFNVVTNIVQNFTDSSIFNLNDSTLIICTGSGASQVCDTIHLGTTNTYYFTITGDTLITCDTVQIICDVPDSCYQQQLCDTILLSQPPPITVYQSGVQKVTNTNIVEHGNDDAGNSIADLWHNTWLYTGGFQYTIRGATVGGSPFRVEQGQWSQESPGITSFNHYGAYPPTGRIDGNNPVDLTVGYINPLYLSSSFPIDTLGLMGDSGIGYYIGANTPGSRYGLGINSNISKQTGIFFHTLDTASADGVTIFAQQVPSAYCFACNPQVDSSLYDQRVAVFKTNHSVQFPAYGDGAFTAVPSKISGWDSDGNFVEIDTTDIGGSITFIDSTKIIICSFGNYLCDTIYTTTGAGASRVYAQNGLTALNDSTVEIGGTGIKFTNINWGQFSWTNTFNTIDSSGFILSSNSTGAANNRQRVVDISLSGANSNSGQSTYGLYSVNTHTGTGSVNYGIYGEASGGSSSNYGVYGTAPNVGVYGVSEGLGGLFTSINGGGAWVTSVNNTGLYVLSTNSLALQVNTQPSSTNTVVTMEELIRTSTGTSTAGVGLSIDFKPAAATAGTSVLGNRIVSKITTITAAAEISQMDIVGLNSGSQNTIMSAYGSGVVGIGISSSYTATRLNVVDNTIGTTPMIDISSTSTAASGGVQKVINLSLSGANATASQNTHGIFVINSHTGTNATNIGVYSEVQNGLGSSSAIKGVATTQRGVWGDATSGTGVFGNATSGTGGSFGATNGNAIVASTTSGTGITVSSDSGLPAFFSQIPSSTNTVVEIMRISRGTTGSAANGIAGAIDYYVEESSGVALFSNRIASSWTDVTNGTRSSALTVSGLFSASTVDIFTMYGNGAVKLRPITATAASAIATAEGLLVMVSDTNGTFTSIGMWSFENGAWHKL